MHGSVDGLVLVGLAEGVLLGIVYAACGVPHPTVFGALTAVAAMIPFAAPVVFGIAALVLLGGGSDVAAIIVLVAGMLVTFTADHFVRPMLIGGATKLPFIWVLLGILGGLEAWGLIGLFIGPAVMAALMLLWREWMGAPVSAGQAPGPGSLTGPQSVQYNYSRNAHTLGGGRFCGKGAGWTPDVGLSTKPPPAPLLRYHTIADRHPHPLVMRISRLKGRRTVLSLQD